MNEEFEHDVRHQLDFTITLKPENTQALLGMTPHAWRSSPETQQQLIDNPQLELRVNVNIDSFTPKVIESVENIETVVNVEPKTEDNAELKAEDLSVDTIDEAETKPVSSANQGIWKTKH